MNDASSFPFLRVPCLVQDEILKCMDINNCFKLSTISNKTKCVVKSFFGRHNSEMDVHLDDCFIVNFADLSIRMEKQNSKTQAGLEYSLENISKHLTNCENDGQFVSYWKSKHMKVAMKFLIEYLAEVFNKPSIRLVIKGKVNFFVINLIQIMKKLNLNIVFVAVKSNYGNDTFYQDVMDECEDASKVYIACYTTPHFGYEYTPRAPFQNDSLAIAKAQWVTIFHLNEYFIDCKNLFLYGCEFNNHQITSFLRRWIQGSKLECAKLTFKGDLFSIANDDDLPYSVLRMWVNGINLGNKDVITIGQTNGKLALVFEYGDMLILTTNCKRTEYHEENENIDNVEDVSDDDADYDNELIEDVAANNANEDQEVVDDD